MASCLITGCEGFVGSHLADLLVKKGLRVYGTVYEDTGNLDHLKGSIETFRCDVKDKVSVKHALKASKPDYVFHLAAQSYVMTSWENPELTIKTNILGTLNILNALRELKLDPVVEIVGSSSVYGPRSKEELPLREDADFKPTSFYALSKVGEEMLGYMYYKVYGMKIIRVRPFNMTGPRKTGDACSDFARGLVEIKKGLKNTLEVGNLETVRDFTDGRDAVKALWLLAEKGIPGEVYNLCSGRGYKMREILNEAIKLSGLSNVKVVQVTEKIRPYDDPIYIGDNSKLLKLGWKPEIDMRRTLSDMLEYWEKRI